MKKKHLILCHLQHLTVTVQEQEGTLLRNLICPHVYCSTVAVVEYEDADTTSEPTHEWYKPDEEETKGLQFQLNQHVVNGGLLLRQIKN